MDAATADRVIFLLATFAAPMVAGLAGFAFGLVPAAVWLHILTPLQTATLIIAFGLIVQGVAVWKLRRALSCHGLWPILVGVPVGVVVLDWANPDYMATVGAVLILYSIYGLVRPTMKPIIAGGAPADTGIGLLNGILGGATGLAGVRLSIIGLPILLAGTWLGLKVYGRVDDAGFRTIVLVVLLVSDHGLIVSAKQVALAQWGLR